MIKFVHRILQIKRYNSSSLTKEIDLLAVISCTLVGYFLLFPSHAKGAAHHVDTLSIVDSTKIEVFNKPYFQPNLASLQAEPAVLDDLELSSCISGYVWLDDDENGIMGANETGVENVLVKLYDFAGRPSGTSITDDNGYFKFFALRAGQYNIEFIQPLGYDFTIQEDGANDDRVSIADPTTGWGQTVASECVEDETEEQVVAAGLVTLVNEGPTVVDLLSFTARQDGDAIVVRWQTGAEVDTQGFDLYRSTTGHLNDDAVLVTNERIPARGSEDDIVTTYEYRDISVLEGVIYSYWLKETETSGNIIDYGPAHAQIQAASQVTEPSPAPRQVYLPLITR